MQPDPFISGYRLIDGDELNAVTSNPQWSVTGDVTATPGGTVVTSAKAFYTITHVTTASAPNAGIVIPQALPGRVLIIVNNGANDIVVFAEDSTIEGIPGDVGIPLTAGYSIFVFAPDASQWVIVKSEYFNDIILPGVVGYLYSDGINPVKAVLTNGQSRNSLAHFSGTSGAGPGATWLSSVEDAIAADHNDTQDAIAISYYAAFWPTGETIWTYVRTVLKNLYGWSDATADARILAAQTYAYTLR